MKDGLLYIDARAGGARELADYVAIPAGTGSAASDKALARDAAERREL